MQGALSLQYRFQGILRHLESDLEFIADDLEHMSLVVSCGGIQDIVVAPQGSLHGYRITFPYGNIADDIRE